MARKMKVVVAPRKEQNTLTVEVDPLAVGSGHRVLPRSVIHETPRRPSRAKAKRQWKRQLSHEGGTLSTPLGPLV